MSEPRLSDWTLVAYRQREEARRRQEQKSAPPPSEQQSRERDERRFSEVTVASLQRRFVLLEQRLAILEQRERERQIKEKFEVPAAQSQKAKPESDAISFGNAVSAAVGRGEQRAPAKSQPEFTHTKVEKAESIDDRKANERHAPSPANDPTRVAGGGFPSDVVEIRPERNAEPIHVEPARKIAGSVSSLIAVALLASSMGFFIAIFAVSKERATQFHALVNIAVKAMSDVRHTK